MPKFLRELTACHTIEEVDKLLRVKTQTWRRKPLIPRDTDVIEGESEDGEIVSGDGYDSLALLAECIV